MVVDSILPQAEFGSNDHRKDAPPFIIKKPALDLIKAAKIRTRLIKYMKIIFEEVDFLITPTCGQTPEPIHEGDSICKFFD